MQTSKDISSKFKSLVEIEKDSKVFRNFSVTIIQDQHCRKLFLRKQKIPL